MIRQNMGPGSFRNRTGRSNEGRKLSEMERQNNRNYNRSVDFLGLENLFGGGGQPEMQTTTQQNLPSWAIPDAKSTLAMGNYYTQNPDYRPSTLDRDYSGLRGYDPTGLPNSQVGQFGLNPTGYTTPLLADPTNNSNTQRQFNQSPNLDDLVAQLPPDMQRQTGGPLMRAPIQVSNDSQRFKQLQNRAEMFEMAKTNPEYAKNMDLDQMFGATEASQIRQNLGRQISPDMQRQTGGPLMRAPLSGRGMGRSTAYNYSDGYGSGDYSYSDQGTDNYYESDTYDGSFIDPSSYSDGYDESDSGYDITSPPAVDGGLEFSSEDSWIWGSGDSDNNDNTSSSSDSSSSNTSGNTGTTTTTQPEIDPRDIFNPDELTPFSAYDRQRFAAPGQNTLRGEGILAGRYDQRFGEGGTDPFAAATSAVDKAAGYGSTYKGLMDSESTLAQSGGYQTGLGTATDPNIFKSGDYTADLTEYTNPNADLRNVNAGIGNVNAGVQNVNAGLRSQQFGNANEGLQGPVNYQQQRSLRDSMQQFQDPYTDRVVNQTIKDMDRARQMTANQISGDSAKAGAYGGSRSMLMQAENNRNFADRTAAAVGQLRSQGFQRAADLAQQENLQRLGLSASDVQQARGLQSQGNLQGQNLTARDLQDVRGLQSQGALTAQGLRSQGGLAAQGLQSQGALAAQGLQSQGALAALGANAGLYQSALGLNAAGDRSAMGYNAGLLSDAMGLDAADLNQRRNLASNEAQFAETANRGAGALNLQGGQALGQLAQAGTADERQRIGDTLAAGGAQDARNQQDLDFIYNEFNRELAYPGQQIDLRNAAISPATGSIVTTTQPRYQQNPILGGAGAALAAYGMTSNPWIAGGAGLLSLLG